RLGPRPCLPGERTARRHGGRAARGRASRWYGGRRDAALHAPRPRTLVAAVSGALVSTGGLRGDLLGDDQLRDAPYGHPEREPAQGFVEGAWGLVREDESSA